ncbi:MAG: TIGR03668 family PPOX class F420-dependent oxidoreductase [Jatrophihabitans sp.]|uniref:TIGR03668 family PPOX class F420-dependent oxidoreductase n=1 Tax=Jatrophihabitans sp. TaxID=1932789 RepID=UPI003F8210A5
MRLTGDEARERFAGGRVARLATVRAGAPRVVPIVFAVEGDTVYSAVDHKPKSTRALLRLDDVATQPEVSLLVDEYAEDWSQLWWARADGRARVLKESKAEAAIELLVARYDEYARNRPLGPVLAIAVSRWSGWAAT